MGTIGNPKMVSRVMFLAQIPTLSYIVKIFKLDFLKKGSPKSLKLRISNDLLALVKDY